MLLSIAQGVGRAAGKIGNVCTGSAWAEWRSTSTNEERVRRMGYQGEQGKQVAKQALPQEMGPLLAVDPTGVPHLDEVLGGGVPRGALAIVVGPPGSGKTTLACQMAFETARSRGSVLVLTALSETSTKLLIHLRGFHFFDPKLVGDKIQFLSMEHMLGGGLAATADEMVAIARKLRASLVVLDGFRGVRESEVETQAARRFLYSVGARLGVLGVTTVITSEAEPHDPEFFTEATTADVIVGLHSRLEGVRQLRGLEVVKVRGAPIMPGLHGFELTDEGAVVIPRLEARVVAERDQHHDHNSTGRPRTERSVQEQELALEAEQCIEEADEPRARFNVPELDAMLGGGLTASTATVVVGSPGTGKTLLALHFALAGVAAHEPAVYVSMRETPAQLLRKARMFALGAPLRAALAPGGGLTIQGWDPVEINPDVIAERILKAVDDAGARRLVVDSIDEIEHAITRAGDAGRTDDYLAALTVALRRRGVSALIINETPTLVASQLHLALDPISVLSDNVLWLQQITAGGELHRLLSVAKMRFSAHDMRVREFMIASPQGIEVLPPGSVEWDTLGEHVMPLTTGTYQTGRKRPPAKATTFGSPPTASAGEQTRKRRA